MLSTPSRKNPRPDQLIRLGGGLLAAGMLCTLVAMTPILTNGSLTPLWWVLPMAGCAAGLTILLFGTRAQARSRSRAVAAAGLRSGGGQK